MKYDISEAKPTFTFSPENPNTKMFDKDISIEIQN